MPFGSFIAAGMVSQWEFLYGANSRSCCPIKAKEGPTSTTSGARLWPLRDLTACSSSAELALGDALSIVMPYFLPNESMISP